MLLNNILQILVIVDFFLNIEKKTMYSTKKLVALRAPKQNLKRILYIFYLYL